MRGVSSDDGTAQGKAPRVGGPGGTQTQPRGSVSKSPRDNGGLCPFHLANQLGLREAGGDKRVIVCRRAEGCLWVRREGLDQLPRVEQRRLVQGVLMAKDKKGIRSV